MTEQTTCFGGPQNSAESWFRDDARSNDRPHNVCQAMQERWT